MNFPHPRTVYISQEIEKRRKLNNGERQAGLSHNLSISEEMKKNIETTFQDQIKQLIKDAPTLSGHSNEIDSESILAQTSQEVKRIPCYTKEYEETMMRRPTGTETGCQNGEECECMLVAQTNPTISSEKAFIGVA